MSLVGKYAALWARIAAPPPVSLTRSSPPFRSLLPTAHTAIATVDIASLVDSIGRVALMSDRGAQVRLAFDNDEVVLTAGGDDSGEAEETLSVKYWGEPMTIAFNPSYLLDGLSVIDGPTATFGFTPNRPAVIVPGVESDRSQTMRASIRPPLATTFTCSCPSACPDKVASRKTHRVSSTLRTPQLPLLGSTSPLTSTPASLFLSVPTGGKTNFLGE